MNHRHSGTNGGVLFAADFYFQPWLGSGRFPGAPWTYWQWRNDVEPNSLNLRSGDETQTASQTLTPELQTELRLRTGGKKLAGHRDLHCLNVTGGKEQVH